jgi:hypothetical protein
MTDANLPSAAALGWAGLMAPAGTPPEVAAKMNAAANRALAREDEKKILMEQGYDVLGGTPAELTAWIRRDAAMWRRLVAEIGGGDRSQVRINRISLALLDDLIGDRQQGRREHDSKRLGCLHVEDQIELGGLLNWKATCALAFENAVDVRCHASMGIDHVGSV